MSTTPSRIKLPESPKPGYEVKLATPAEAREFKDRQIYWFCTFEYPDEWIGPCTSSGCCAGLHLRYAYLAPIAEAPAEPALVIEVGKFNQTRCGLKARIYAKDGANHTEIHGAISDGGKWVAISWAGDGRFGLADHPYDLIGPWIDRPEIDFSKWPEFFKAWAMDKNGSWYVYKGIPSQAGESWVAAAISYTQIPPEHAPKWEGDWRDSLVVRPEGGAK